MFLQSIVMNGVYSAIPYTVLAVLVIVSGLATDCLRNICLSTTTVRKIFTSAGTLYCVCVSVCVCVCVCEYGFEDIRSVSHTLCVI